MTRTLDALVDLAEPEIRELAAYVDSTEPTSPRLAGRVVAVLAFGPTSPSTSAWIAAASRLGAGVLRRDDFDPGADDFDVCAEAAKWADLFVLSHPLNGFARAGGEST